MATPSSKSIAAVARARSGPPAKPTKTERQPNSKVSAPVVGREKPEGTSGLAGLTRAALTNITRAAAAAKPGSSSSAPAPGKPGKPGTPGNPNTIKPFLTPTQQAALTTFDTNSNYSLIGIGQKVQDAVGTTNRNLATAQQQHDVSTNNTNQGMAARGLFESSIRDGALNDIDSTLQQRQNTLNSALNTLTLGAINDSARLTTNSATQHTLYDQFGIANAQSITPLPATPPTPATPATTTTHITTTHAPPKQPDGEQPEGTPALAGLNPAALSALLAKSAGTPGGGSSAGPSGVGAPS